MKPSCVTPTTTTLVFLLLIASPSLLSAAILNCDIEIIYLEECISYLDGSDATPSASCCEVFKRYSFIAKDVGGTSKACTCLKLMAKALMGTQVEAIILQETCGVDLCWDFLLQPLIAPSNAILTCGLWNGEIQIIWSLEWKS